MLQIDKKKEKSSILDYINNNSCHLIFDFDGTIADTEYYHQMAYIKILSEYGVKEDDFDFRKYVGNKEEDIFRKINTDYDLRIDISKAKNNRLEIYSNLIIKNKLQPYDYIEDIFNQSEKRTAILLSSQTKWLVLKQLKDWGLEKYFTELITSEDIPISKNKTLPLLMSKLDKSKLPAIHFEDSQKTLDISKKLGNKCVYIKHGLNCNPNIKFDWQINVMSR